MLGSRVVRSVLVVAIFLAAGSSVSAQSPQPGTVCVTPRGSCNVQPPGLPGAICFCPSPQGPPVQGVLK